MELSQQIGWEFDASKKVGHMRVDFSDGHLANQWIASEKFESVPQEHRKAIQDAVNSLVFERFNSFEKIEDEADEIESGDKKYLFGQDGEYNYWLQLNPAQREYNLYIDVYEK